MGVKANGKKVRQVKGKEKRRILLIKIFHGVKVRLILGIDGEYWVGYCTSAPPHHARFASQSSACLNISSD